MFLDTFRILQLHHYSSPFRGGGHLNEFTRDGEVGACLARAFLRCVSVNDIWNKSYMNCGNEMKMKKWSSQWMQFMQLRKEAWKKFRTSTGFELVTSRLLVRQPTIYWPAPNASGFIAQLVEHPTGNCKVTGSKPVEVLNFFQASLRNCINCIHCDDHFFIFKCVSVSLRGWILLCIRNSREIFYLKGQASVCVLL